ncbi:MAG TPA: NAD(P)/FAD-dependent oxidoreductase [Pseudogracilibacillus sp.]|nr:NAD(P)/FAD-dependent oxidoreductase [Pseudogracilibacillus sp.]
MTYDVAVIGGGSSGLMAAISASEFGAKTVLLEKGTKLGSKLMISGGGRCNVTNRLPLEKIVENIPGNGKFLYSAFSVFNHEDIIAYFEQMGIALKEEDHGRMFPVTNSAKSVVDTLVHHLRQNGVEMKLNSAVRTIDYGDEYHVMSMENGDTIQAKAIVVAVGGKSVPNTGSTGDGYPWAQKAGHTITKLYPTEVALTSNEPFIKKKLLQGISLRNVALTVLNKRNKPIVTHEMDMIFTHFGISGPATLRCSQFVVKQLWKQEAVTMEIDLLPKVHKDALFNNIRTYTKVHPKRTVKNMIKELTDAPERFVLLLFTRIELEEQLNVSHVSNEMINKLVHEIKHFSFAVHGSLSIEKAFVTGGGISTKEIVPNTMESKKMPRLFFCGEILDIHGYTGGYNITAALVTGRLAGMNAAFYQ